MRRLKSVCAGTLICGILFSQVLFTGSPAEAAKGTWKQDAKGWWYSYGGSAYAKNEWVQDGGKWYYFGSNGYMVKGWQKIGTVWYYFDGGAMTTGWKKISGKWYYFETSGAMVSGWKKISGKWHYFADGAMVTGWKKLSGKWYYFDKNGYMQTGWKKFSDVWYYFNPDGSMAVGDVTIEGVRYSFDENGVLIETPTIWTLDVGDSFTFGSFEQDGDDEDGTESIEWIILAKEDSGRMLLLSKSGLDSRTFAQPQDGYSTSTRWSTCELRTWLNEDFYNAAFTEDEMAFIEETYVINSTENTELNTQDHIFLLSEDELVQYLPKELQRGCKPTAVAAEDVYSRYSWDSSKPASYVVFSGCSPWWLRTSSELNSACVKSVAEYDGSVKSDYFGANVKFLVRPAFWFNPYPESGE